MKIQNSRELAQSDARKAALEIAEAGLAAIDTKTAVREAVKLSGNTLSIQNEKFELSPQGKLVVVGVGKCAQDAGEALEEVLGERLTGGILLVPSTVGKPESRKLITFLGTHPFPTTPNVEATKEIIQLVSGLGGEDTVLFIISGGGSTLLCQPQDHRSEDETCIMRRLFEVGANIEDINTLRKHTSLARGGWLAQYTYPAQAVSLIFSDVPGAALSSIASGPTVKDDTTAEDAEKILEKYDIRAKCNLPKLEPLETPKEEKFFKRVSNRILVSNEVALEAMFHKAQELGFTPHVRTSALQGEAQEVGKGIAADLARQEQKTALLYGGETTVVIWNTKGKGGRDLELLLAALPELGPDELILAFASDGRDNTDIAGGISDIMTKVHAEKLGFDPSQFLADNDSYNFFQKTGDAVITGNTGSNVSDLIIALKK